MTDKKKPHTAGTGTASNPVFISGDHTVPLGLPYVAQFKDVIQAAGLTPPNVIEPGKFHRFPGDGKGKSNEAGWCKLFADGRGGVFGDYSTGLSADWHAERERPFTDAERATFKRQIAEACQHAEAQKAQEQADAASKAQTIWGAATDAPSDHPYLIRKGINANGARLYGDALVIPLRAGADLHSLQFIGEDGVKRFLSGGRVAGCYFIIGSIKGATVLCIVEGFATGASIHEATGYPVVVAINCGNLLAVALAIRGELPDLLLIFCADDDHQTAGNPGVTKATEAAQAVGGRLALPDFGTDRPSGATDFNDMAALCGKDAVREAVERATELAKATTTASNESAPASEYATNAGDAEHIERLAKLSPIEYDRVREKEAKALGIRAATLDKMVGAQRKDQTETAGIDFDDVEAWPHPVDGAVLLSNLSAHQSFGDG